jgi:hypothetical protein
MARVKYSRAAHALPEGGRWERLTSNSRAAPPSGACEEENSEMSNLVHNERLKLRATFLSNFGIAAFIACFITPGFFAFAETRIERLIVALLGLVFCGILHVFATNKLRGLRE